MNGKIMFGILIFAAVSKLCFAQSAEKIEEIINSQFLSKGQACYLIGTATGKLSDSAHYRAAFDAYSGLKMFKNASADETISLAEFSNLVLLSSEQKGGLWCRISNSPYYALRHFKLKGLVKRNAVGSTAVTPIEAFGILSKI